MKKLSADVLFYIRLAWSIIVPVLILICIRLTPFNFPGSIFSILSVLIAVLVIYQIYYVSKFRQVIYQDKALIINNYFTKKSIVLPVSAVISLIKKPNLQIVRRIKNMTYKLTYINNDRKQTIYFFKSIELYNIDDIALLIGVGTYVETGFNDDIVNINGRIAASFKLNVESRFTSAIMDWFIMTALLTPFALPDIISSISNNDENQHGILLYIFLIGFALFFCKDSIYGQSIGKRIMRQQVINNKTGQIANPLRCFVRDIFMVLWPIEVLITKVRRFYCWYKSYFILP